MFWVAGGQMKMENYYFPLKCLVHWGQGQSLEENREVEMIVRGVMHQCPAG